MAELIAAANRPQPSERKLAANRVNAQKSSGPKTAQGKAKSSQNSVKYGFYAQAVVLPGEDPLAYEALRDHLWTSLRPENALEELYVREIVDAHWRLQRLSHVEGTVLTRRSISFTGHDCGPGFAFVNDAQGLNAFSRLGQAEAVVARRLYKAMEQFRKLREKGLPDRTPGSDAKGDTAAGGKARDAGPASAEPPGEPPPRSAEAPPAEPGASLTAASQVPPVAPGPLPSNEAPDGPAANLAPPKEDP